MSTLKTQSQIIQDLVAKTYRELAEPPKPHSRSRTWSSPRAYRFLVQWSNSVLLRILVRKFTLTLPKSEHRTKTQTDDAARSVVSNLEEGFRRPTTSAYLEFIGYAEASLEEIRGLIAQCHQDGFLHSRQGSSIAYLGINLKAWNTWCQNPLHSLPAQAGSRILYFPLNRNKGNYRTLKEIKGTDLSYQIFLELINKTDYLLRQLVASLETKLNHDHKSYQVEKARVRRIATWKK